MKLTKDRLKNIIKEEIDKINLQESGFYLDEGRYEEDPEFQQDMNALGKDLGKVMAYLKNQDRSNRLNLSSLPIEFRATAGGSTKACMFSARLEKINNETGGAFGGGQPGIMSFMKKYPPCPDQ